MIKMTETNRIQLAQRADRDEMYGPAFTGLPTRNGHLVSAPEIGDKLHVDGMDPIVITAIAYDVTRNRVVCTLDKAGEITQRGWGQLLSAIEDGRISID